MSKIIFHVELHPDDAERVMRVAAACGVEPSALIALAAYRYALLIESGKELPPGRGAERQGGFSERPMNVLDRARLHARRAGK